MRWIRWPTALPASRNRRGELSHRSGRRLASADYSPAGTVGGHGASPRHRCQRRRFPECRSGSQPGTASGKHPGSAAPTEPAAVRCAHRRQKTGCPLNLDIEMETGTGKTYCYIKSMFELNKRHGWSKFIVVVPSIAIREGVYKSLQITAEHFLEAMARRRASSFTTPSNPHNWRAFPRMPAST
jgi:Rad3-related DNA helicase